MTDAIADPPGSADALHTEKLLRLPAPFLCYRPPQDAPEVAHRESGEIVFGSFNALVKVNEPLVALWSRVLAAVPRSRLVLKAALLEDEPARARLLERFEAHGIARDRVTLRAWSDDRRAHMTAYGEIDVALDTFPYNGTTTTCEALWMGVPVITLAGDVHMARVGATLLASVGLDALVAPTPDEYVQIAHSLAADAERRAKLRAGMRARLTASKLLDHAGYTRRLEAAYRDAWRAWCAAGAREAVAT